MGYSSARDMLEHTNLTTALRWHLTSNHFPPVPESCLPVARKAIHYAKREEWDRRLRLPEGMTHRHTGSLASVAECVRAWHLDAFLE